MAFHSGTDLQIPVSLGKYPLYLSDLLHSHTSSRFLGSVSRFLLDVPRLSDCKTKRYGQLPFTYVAPSLRTILTGSTEAKDSIQSVRASLKASEDPLLYLGRTVAGMTVPMTVCAMCARAGICVECIGAHCR